MASYLAIFALFAVASPALAKEMMKVNVTVYYETLCKDSQKFITKQLYPTYSSPLGERINIMYVPYGKATMTGTPDSYEFVCRHGAVECYGDKVQSCASTYMRDEPKKLAMFINCLMDMTMQNKPASNDDYPTNACAKKADISMSDMMNQCISGTEGWNLLAGNGNKTAMLEPKLDYVPTIVFDNKFVKDTSKRAEKDLKGEICSMLKDEKLTECKGNSGHTIVGSAILLVSAMVISRL